MAAKFGIQKTKHTKSKPNKCFVKAAMSLKQIEKTLTEKLNDFTAKGTLKGEEKVITGIIAAKGGFGPR